MARTPKLDSTLADAVDLARRALQPLVPTDRVGEHLGATAEADRLVTHRFAADEPGYHGWQWYVTLSRASRSKAVTVSESGLLPGPDALLAPPWVPWAERMAPEEVAAAKAVADEEAGPQHPHSRTDAAAAAGTGSDDETVDVKDQDDAGDAERGGHADEASDQAGDATSDDADAQSEPAGSGSVDGGDAEDGESDEAATEASGGRRPRRRRRSRRR